MLLRWLISALGVSTLKSEISAAMKRAGRRALLTAVAFFLWLAALAFAVAALVVWLSHELGSVAACGILAAILAVLALAVHVTLSATAAPRRREAPPPLADLAAALDGKPGAGGGSLESMIVIAIAGYLLGRRAFRR